MLYRTVSQVGNVKLKFLKEAKSASPVNVRMRNLKSLKSWYGERSGSIQEINQPQHSLKPKSNPERDPNSLQFCKAERGMEAVEDQFEASRG